MNSILRSIILIIVSTPQLASALELNLSNHWKQLSGPPKKHAISFDPNTGYQNIDKLMSKYFIDQWNDDNIQAKIGASSNSIFFIIDNKTTSYIQYKLDLKDDAGNKFGFKPQKWFDLMPQETDHVGGTPFFVDAPYDIKSLKLNIQTRTKKFKSDVEKYFAPLVYSHSQSIDLSEFRDNVFKTHRIFPHYDIYRKDPTNTKLDSDLNKVDDILSLINRHRNQIGLTNVQRYLERQYDSEVMGIYDKSRGKVIVTTGSSIPNTTLVRFNHVNHSSTDYYFYSESTTDYAGGLVGALYCVLFKVNPEKSSILYEKEGTGYVTLTSISDLFTFPNTDKIFVLGSSNSGVSSSTFAAKLQGGRLVNKIHFNTQSEEGREACPENPFRVCG